MTTRKTNRRKIATASRPADYYSPEACRARLDAAQARLAPRIEAELARDRGQWPEYDQAMEKARAEVKAFMENGVQDALEKRRNAVKGG